jgi:hypothetical protein
MEKEKRRKGEREKGRKGEWENGRKGEWEKGRKGKREKGKKEKMEIPSFTLSVLSSSIMTEYSRPKTKDKQ